MPRPYPIIRTVLVGRLPNGENFQTGFWISEAAPNMTMTALQAESNAIAAIFTTRSTGIRALTTNTTNFDEIRCYYYPSASPAPAALIASSPLTLTGSGSGATQLPNQIALVVTLSTGFAGRRRKGRMYFPCNYSALEDNQASQATITNLNSDVSLWFTDINASSAVVGSVSVASFVDGVAFPVTSTRVDSRCDVQRRRAAQETELRQSPQFAVTP